MTIMANKPNSSPFRRTVRCSRCGRPLRAQASRARRIGPCCLAFELRVAAAQAVINERRAG
jgi:ribosomal protein S14